MAGIPRSKRTAVLDLWSEGFTGDEIATRLGCGTRFDVSVIVRAARDGGDPRAAPHFGRGMGAHVTAADELFARAQYLRMDAAFKAQLMRAIRGGKERATVGIYRSRLPGRVVPLRLTAEPRVSLTGSSAGECADIGAAAAAAVSSSRGKKG
jgi:hypothetical protein